MRGKLQTTINSTIRFAGIGLHSGVTTKVAIRPAAADFGIRFRRVDASAQGVEIAAHWSRLEPAPLCTRIGDGNGESIDTIEHLMAALAGCGIHNALVEVGGPEIPILDGSAKPFVAGILACGVRHLDVQVRALRIRERVEVRNGDAIARLEPSDRLEIAFDIDFADSAIGHQELTLDMANGTFVRELSDSRTFCSRSDVQTLRANGLARGGSLENALVFDGAEVLSPGGLRHADEPVRHKMLDAMGDLALAGAPLIGRYTGVRAGHALTGWLLRTVFERESAWEEVTLAPSEAAHLPGFGISAGELRTPA